MPRNARPRGAPLLPEVLRNRARSLSHWPAYGSINGLPRSYRRRLDFFRQADANACSHALARAGSAPTRAPRPRQAAWRSCGCYAGMKNSPCDERDLTPRQRRKLIVLPLMGLGVAYLLALTLGGLSRANEMVAAALANLAILGSTVILGGAMTGASGFGHLSAWELALVSFVLDALLTPVLLGIVDLGDRARWLGPKIQGMRRNARARMREHPWVRHWASLGVGLFVLSPLPSSGVVAGSVFARLLGLSRWHTFFTVTIANLLVCVLYAWGADALGAFMTRHDWSVGQRLGLLAGVVVLVTLTLRFVARDVDGVPSRKGT
jgi:uncharacterized membrane protein